MADGPRGRRPFSPTGERSGHGKVSGGTYRDEGRRDSYGSNRGNSRSPQYREGRSAHPQGGPPRTVHYQVVTMTDEEWGDALEHRLNALGREGWRLVAIDEERQYVFMQAD